MSEREDVYDRLEAMGASADPAERTVATLWKDVTGRRGWRQEADTFADEIKHEILDTWLSIIRQ